MKFVRRAASFAIAAAALTVPLPVAASPAQDPAPSPERSVLAIVSPLAFPACSASGSASLLVPIVGGVAADALALGDSVSIGDLLLDALGPVYLACGTLPAAPGQRCQLDADLGMLWPEQISSAAGPLPPIAGGGVDSLDAALFALGLPPQAALGDALQCAVPAPPAVPPPFIPPSVDAAPALSPAGAASSPANEIPVSRPGGTTRPSGAPAVASAGTASLPAAPQSSDPPTLLQALVGDRVPGGVVALQLLVAATLALFLAGSWVSSVRTASVDLTK